MESEDSRLYKVFMFTSNTPTSSLIASSHACRDWLQGSLTDIFAISKA